MINSLIDKRDRVEAVRDAVATILLSELASQQTLASAESKDPRLWDLRVFSDRGRPWPQFLEDPAQLDGRPVVNILVDRTKVNESASDVVKSQSRRLTLWIDCYGYGLTQADGSGGQIAGDRVAALESQRAARLVRNILMSASYTYLGLRGLVWNRMLRSVEVFDPALEGTRAEQNVIGLRLHLDVDIAETSPQVEPEIFESIRLTVNESTSELNLLTAEWPVDPYVPPAPTPYVDPPIDAVTINALIDKQDNLERVRAQVASILATEQANQQTLASGAGRDPEQWRLRVFEERTNPWSEFLDAPASAPPIVNVHLDSTSVELAASDVVHRQVYTGRINVDVYGYGASKASDGGHIPGDELAAEEAQRGARLVRNILQAAEYTYLGLRGTVGRRMIMDTTQYRPEPGPLQNVTVVRLVLEVRFVELSPQITPETGSGVRLEVFRAETGELLVDLDFAD